MNDKDKQYKIKVLRMVYKDINFITDEIYQATDGKETVIADLDGNEFIKGNIQDVNVHNTFILCINANSCNLINIESRKILKNIGQYNVLETDFSSDIAFILNRHNDELTLYNKNLDVIGQIKDVVRIYNNIKTQGNKVYFNYNLNYIKICKACVDIIHNNIVYYDTFELKLCNGSSDYALMAVEQVNKATNKVNTDAMPYFKYKLVKSGVIINSDKAYADISKPINLINTDYFIVYDCDKYGHTITGLIDSKGKTIIPLDLELCNIEYLGSHNFLVHKHDFIENIMYSSIYNLDNGIIAPFNKCTCAFSHESLPLTIVQINQNVYGLKSDGQWFNILEISKYFSCFYCLDEPSIIKVDLDYGVKYVTNKLQPIKNIQFINRLNNLKWIPIQTN